MNKNELNSTFSQIFFKSIPVQKKRPLSFLGSIIKSNENRLHALLAYCLNPNIGHDVNHIFIESLIECANDKGFQFNLQDYFEDYEVISEHRTIKKGRIDFLIKTLGPWDSSRKAVIIELKMDSSLHNDLEDYFDSIKDCREENKIGIVLSLNDLSKSIHETKFCNILLQDYFNKIKEYYEKECTSNQHINFFFKDFFNYIDTINTNLYNSNIHNNLYFLFENNELISQLNDELKNKDNPDLFSFYALNKHNINNLREIINGVKSGITVYINDWKKVNNRKGQTLDSGISYLRGQSNGIFKDLYRFKLDYSNCFKQKPLIIFSLEINTNFNIEELFGVNLDWIINLFNTNNNNKNGIWLELKSEEYSNPNEISKFDSFFLNTIFPRITELEDYMNKEFISQYESLIIKNIVEKGSSLTQEDNSIIVDTINDGRIIREPEDSIFLSVNFIDYQVHISIWSTTKTQDWLSRKLIEKKSVDYKNCAFDDPKCFFTVDLMEDNRMAEVFRNFIIKIKFSNSLEVLNHLDIEAEKIFLLVKEMKTINDEAF